MDLDNSLSAQGAVPSLLPPSLTSLSEMSSEAIDSSTLNLDDSSLSKMTIRSPLRGPYLRQCPQSHMSVFPISTSGA